MSGLGMCSVSLVKITEELKGSVVVAGGGWEAAAFVTSGA
jgi:hypothetical protein